MKDCKDCVLSFQYKEMRICNAFDYPMECSMARESGNCGEEAREFTPTLWYMFKKLLRLV